ncbi:MAG: Crp/Fnr family transcriptional regulator [Tissierella sp.]|nr:Crp/Fnr family transcriptional regulator [Tissierella sp.]
MHSILREISEIPNVKINDFEELFQEEYSEILNHCQVIKLEAGSRFIAVDEKINTVWILILGQVKALEEYSTGDIYTFKKFPAPEVFGEMEVLADIFKFRATLITESECVFINMPVEYYKEFLKSNSEYLYKRTNIILKRVLDEQKHMRMFLMIKSIDRIKIYLIQHYQLYAKDNICILRITRQQIAEETGYAVKTVNRVIKKLEDQNLLKIEGQKIIIIETQYEKMYKSVENYVNY